MAQYSASIEFIGNILSKAPVLVKYLYSGENMSKIANTDKILSLALEKIYQKLYIKIY